MQSISLSDDELANLILLHDELDTKFAKDPWRWACEQVITIDEAADRGAATRRRWPKHLKYVQEAFQVLDNEQFVIFPKSRRMFVTWLICAYFTHHTRYK